MHILDIESILLTLISAANEQSTSLFRSTCTYTYTHTHIMYVYTLKTNNTVGESECRPTTSISRGCLDGNVSSKGSSLVSVCKKHKHFETFRTRKKRRGGEGRERETHCVVYLSLEVPAQLRSCQNSHVHRRPRIRWKWVQIRGASPNPSGALCLHRVSTLRPVSLLQEKLGQLRHCERLLRRFPSRLQGPEAHLLPLKEEFFVAQHYDVWDEVPSTELLRIQQQNVWSVVLVRA